MKIAILGWGSLLWEERPEFNEHHGEWLYDGPILNLEFSRISSKSRNSALSLVLDYEHGSPCTVAYTFSKRRNPDDAICDLRCREGTILRNIGYYFADSSRIQDNNDAVIEVISSWSAEKEIDVVIWTRLKSKFSVITKKPYSHEAALEYLRNLPKPGKASVAEYIYKAPDFITSALPKLVQKKLWYRWWVLKFILRRCTSKAAKNN